MNKGLGNKKAIALFTLPAFLLFFCIMILPILASFFFSLQKWDGLGEMTFVGLRNYEKLFFTDSYHFHVSVKNTLIIAALSVFIQIPLALLLALLVTIGVKWENFYRTVYFIPVVISSSAIAQLFLKIYNFDYGALNTILRSLGLENWCRPWLYDESTALWAAFVPVIWQHIGYHMLILYAGIKAIPPQLLDSAKIDGAGTFRIWRYITIPQLLPMLEVTLTLAVIGALKIFDIMFILTSNGEPLGATIVQTGVMYKLIFEKNNYGTGSAAACFVVAECLIFTLIIRRIFHHERNSQP